MNKTLISALLAAPLLLSQVQPAAADPREGMHREGGGNFERHGGGERPHWREGNWRHGWHDGRIGWWWVAGDLWSFYPAPVYPYPEPYVPPLVVPPPSVVIQQAPPPMPQPQMAQPAVAPQPTQNNWYYCEPAKAYYPYVNSCPSGWKVVPASPPPAPQ